MNKSFNILDPQISGHHREYLLHLAKGAKRLANGLRVRFFVHPEMAEALRCLIEEVEIESLPVEIAGTGKTLPPVRMACDQLAYVLDNSKGEIFLPRYNGYVRALFEMSGGWQKDRKTSGIWFNPRSAGYVYSNFNPIKWLYARSEIHRIHRLANQCGLQRLLILNDAETARYMRNRCFLDEGVDRLSDPVDALPEPEKEQSQLRDELGIQPGSQVWGIFGRLRESKGVVQLLLSLKACHVQSSIPFIILIAGEVLEEYDKAIQTAIRGLRNVPWLEVKYLPGYLTRERLGELIFLSNGMILPYVGSFGSSGLLGHAVSMGKPVIATRTGLVGNLVESYGLGDTYRYGRINELQEVIEAAALGEVELDSLNGRQYLDGNSVEGFVKGILG